MMRKSRTRFPAFWAPIVVTALLIGSLGVLPRLTPLSFGPRVVAAAGETVYLIPAAAQLAGAAGTNWRTDLEIVNPGSTQAAFTVALLKHDSNNSSPQSTSFTLEGGRAVRHSNVLSSMFSFSGKATLRLTVTSGSVLASSRTYNAMVAGNPLGLPAGATFGQFVPAVLDSQAVSAGEAAFLIQLTHTPNPFTNQKEGFRTNLGYVNTTGASLNLTVDLYRADGVKLGSFADSLPAYGYKQVDKVFERATGQAVGDGYAVVRTSTSGGKFLAYASVVDNIVGDPVFVPHRRVTAGPGESVSLIPAAAQLAGAAGTNWRTDLEVVNPGSAQAAFTVALLKHDSNNASPQSKSFTLEGGRAVRYSNVLSSMFGFSGKATLRLTVTSGSVLASSRTYNAMIAGNPLGLPAGATFGQFVPEVLDSQAVSAGEAAFLIQLTHTPNPFTNQKEGFRTNLGYANTTGASLNLTVDLHRADGVKLGSFADSLPAYGYKQVDKVFERVTGQAVTDGYAVVRTTTSGGRFLAYASVVDNIVGDPVFIPHRKVTGGTPPTPTPTSPPAATRPLGTLETTNDIMSILQGGGGGNPSLETVVRELQLDGIEAILNDLVANKPNLVSRVPNGIRVSYGSGYRTQRGDLLIGSVTGTYSNLSVTSSKVTGNYALVVSGFSKNEGYSTIQNVSGAVDLNVTAAGKVAGSVTISGSGTSPVGATTVDGTVQVDTNVCPKYPVGGTVTVRRGSETKTIIFAPSVCDGRYAFTGIPADYAYFELTPWKCDGSAYRGSFRIGLVGEYGGLSVNPFCDERGPRNHQVRGSISPTQATLLFRSWQADHLFQGTFQGTSTDGVVYQGTATYTVTVVDPDGSIRCSSPAYTETKGTHVVLRRTSSSSC